MCENFYPQPSISNSDEVIDYMIKKINKQNSIFPLEERE